MRVCGIEIKGSEAILCLLAKKDGLFDLPDCRARRVPLEQGDSREAIKKFQFTLAKLAEDYRIEKFVIRERMKKGKFAGSADGFKMEAAIELLDAVDVEVMSVTRIKEILNRYPLPVRFSDTGLKPFQETAFVTAYVALEERG